MSSDKDKYYTSESDNSPDIDESSGVLISGFIKITDPDSEEVLVEQKD